jgi:hypothetical protein
MRTTFQQVIVPAVACTVSAKPISIASFFSDLTGGHAGNLRNPGGLAQVHSSVPRQRAEVSCTALAFQLLEERSGLRSPNVIDVMQDREMACLTQ